MEHAQTTQRRRCNGSERTLEGVVANEKQFEHRQRRERLGNRSAEAIDAELEC